MGGGGGGGGVLGRGKAGDEMEGGGGGAGFKMTDCSHKICFRFWVSCRAMQNTRKEKKKKKKKRDHK